MEDEASALIRTARRSATCPKEAEKGHSRDSSIMVGRDSVATAKCVGTQHEQRVLLVLELLLVN
eukprot:scaffold317299_cov23-Tisochrysis_lutea.AAC.1